MISIVVWVAVLTAAHAYEDLDYYDFAKRAVNDDYFINNATTIVEEVYSMVFNLAQQRKTTFFNTVKNIEAFVDKITFKTVDLVGLAKLRFNSTNAGLTYMIRQVNARIVKMALERIHICQQSTEDCAPDDYFDNSVGSYLRIVTRYMDNIYLSDTSHYIDGLVSLCKSVSKDVQGEWVKYVNATRDESTAERSRTVQGIESEIQAIIKNIKSNSDQYADDFDAAMQKAVDAVSSFDAGSHIEKREQEVLQFVAQAHEDSFNEYKRLHNKVAL